MEDKRDVFTPLEDGSARASPVRGVSEQPCLGEERPVSPVSDHSTTGRLHFPQEVPEQPLQHTTGRVGSCENMMGSRRVNPAASVAESLQSAGMVEEWRLQLEMKRLELEAEERREARRLEIEAANEARRLELESEERREARREEMEVRRLEVEKHREFEWERSRPNSTHKGREGEENSVERQMVRSLQLIPDFDEQKVAEWFRRFEKKAAEFGWSEGRWVGLVINKLKGRALEVYDNMSAEDLESYEDFKADILRAYELRPESYRLRFRGGKKRPGDSYLECAHHLEQAFKRWIMSEGVDTLCDLEELMVMEQFINAADKKLVPLLREKRFKTLKEAVTWADDHVLAHR